MAREDAPAGTGPQWRPSLNSSGGADRESPISPAMVWHLGLAGLLVAASDQHCSQSFARRIQQSSHLAQVDRFSLQPIRCIGVGFRRALVLAYPPLECGVVFS